jgi:hypothetical protein
VNNVIQCTACLEGLGSGPSSTAGTRRRRRG